jgi:hypothetical protein
MLIMSNPINEINLNSNPGTDIYKQTMKTVDLQ